MNRKGLLDDVTDMLAIAIGTVVLFFALGIVLMGNFTETNKITTEDLENTRLVNDYLVERGVDVEQGVDSDRVKRDMQVLRDYGQVVVDE